MVLSTEWSQVEVIDLLNDGHGLGFILVGGRSTGVVIKALIPGGIADRDGRLQCGDHVIQIGEINLTGFSSEQVATVLRQTGAEVRLIVARPIDSSHDYPSFSSNAPVILTKLLTDPDELTRHLFEAPPYALDTPYFPIPDTELADLPLPPIPSELTGPSSSGVKLRAHTITTSSTSTSRICPRHLDVKSSYTAVQSLNDITYINQEISNSRLPLSLPSEVVDECNNDEDNGDYITDEDEIFPNVLSPSQDNDSSFESPETETYQVELRKNVYGLGITVAGYVCQEEDLSGIFVKSIIEGSAAEMSGQIQINDRIVAVDGKSLSGVTNHQAVEILRNTDITVHLTLERFLRGRKYEHLQVALIEAKGDVQSQASLPASPSIATLSWVPAKSDADSIVTEDIVEVALECEVAALSVTNTIDSNMSTILQQQPMATTTKNDENEKDNVEIIGGTSVNGISNTDIVSENNPKSKDNNNDITLLLPQSKSPSPTPIDLDSLKSTWKSLGISLEGTVDVEGGVEKRPHHYIRSILEEGPVGKQGIFKPGDELLQVNEHKLQGLKHIDVVKILKELPTEVKLICARGPQAPTIINTSQNPEAFETRSLLPGGHQSLQGLLTKAQSESSLYTSSTATLTDQQRSKSVENVSGLALWTCDVTYITIEKTDRGFGFSILDYQDPLDPDGTVIVIRGLIPGGSAEATNQIFPGDRLVSVNDSLLQGLTLDEAVCILKGIPMGLTKLGICRPLSSSDNNDSSPEDPDVDENDSLESNTPSNSNSNSNAS
ncbi:hypothetical protein ACFFRR_005950 [Megaselia abdita]